MAAFALAAVEFDPVEPPHLAHLADALLYAYLAFSIVLALVFTKSTRPMPHLRVATHAFDLVIAVSVNALTGAGSPFFVLFVFLLVAATLRWQWRGTMWTGAAVVVAYLLLGVYGHLGYGGVGFELNRFLIRGSYLAVVAVLLGSLGTWEERVRRDLVDLAGSPRTKHLSFEGAARESLAYAASVLRAQSVMLAWEDSEEPWLVTLVWKGGHVEQERHRAGTLLPMVAEPLQRSAFLSLDLTAVVPAILYNASEGLLMWRGHPLNPELARRVGARNVLSVPVSGEGVDARLFAFDKPRLTTDDLVVALILGRQIVAALEQHVLVQETETSAANAERMRLARELHDGIAQSLAGAALQIKGLRRTVVSDPPRAQERLDEIERLLVNEQRELRLFMQELRPSPKSVDREGTLEARLHELCHRVSSLWGVEVDLEVSGEIAAPLAWDAYRLVQEALVNAARHAQASQVRVRAATTDDAVKLHIADDGRGFPFRGVYELPELQARGIGPASLKERVASLRGELRVSSGEDGAVIEISLPLRFAQVSS